MVLAGLLGLFIAYMAGRGPGTTSTANLRPTGTTATAVGASSSSKAVPACQSVGLSPTSRAEVTCRTPNATLTFVNGAHFIKLPSFDARVRSVKAYAPSTLSGRERKRMRVVVAFEATATGSRAALATNDVAPVYLSINGVRVAPDGAYREDGAFRLDSALKPGSTRRGNLRFELSGKDTTFFRANGGELAIRPFDPSTVAISRLRPPAEVRSLAPPAKPAGPAEPPAAPGPS
jgi:hypothetical protein